MNRRSQLLFVLFLISVVAFLPMPSFAQMLSNEAKIKILERESFWDNRDFDWYVEHVPFFDCPDADITTTYYYRWELLTKHLTYGSPNSGYSFTEFIDRPFWSGAYGAISCPAGHQLYEARWLRTPTIAEDYSRYWLRTPGAQPRNYSTWLADSIWAVHQVHPNQASLVELLPDLVANYEAWEKRHFVSEVGLFWQTGHDDGMEFNINSRQTKDILRGAPSYRPSFNAYMWADAQAIARIADVAKQPETAKRFRDKAAALHAKMVELLWDEERQFFFPVLRNDEERDGHRLKALTKTYESGQFAGDTHGRELIGYVPWQFGMVQSNTKYDTAWPKLMSRDGFFADFGPSTVERNDPMFLLQKSCCWWSGQSWPYATTQTLKAMATFLQADGKSVSAEDYFRLLSIYSSSHRKDGKPYLAEALHPDTGSFEGHDGYNHSEHYFHSGFCDLIITGLVGLVPRDDASIEVRPLAPSHWDYFLLDDVPYRGHRLTILWDKSGTRYSQGAGMTVLVDGKKIGHAASLEPLILTDALQLPENNKSESLHGDSRLVNFAVNNDGTFFPRVTTSFTAKDTTVSKLNDGNYWYMRHPPNRWTCNGSPNAEDWITIDFGTPRSIEQVKVYVLDDSDSKDSAIRPPKSIRIDSWTNDTWQPIRSNTPPSPIEGRRPSVFKFDPIDVQKLRVTLEHSPGSKAGLTEIETWGRAKLPVKTVPPPRGNLAYNDGTAEYPKATASFHDRFGGVPRSAIDGITNFLPTPMNRWTSYESPNAVDWLKIDFGKSVEFRRVDLAIYDDHGGVQPPTDYSVQVWQDDAWQKVETPKLSHSSPVGSNWNSIEFKPVTADKLRVLFTNRGKARSGVTEVMVWNEDY